MVVEGDCGLGHGGTVGVAAALGWCSGLQNISINIYIIRKI
jgi:hypothetical protein